MFENYTPHFDSETNQALFKLLFKYAKTQDKAIYDSFYNVYNLVTDNLTISWSSESPIHGLQDSVYFIENLPIIKNNQFNFKITKMDNSYGYSVIENGLSEQNTDKALYGIMRRLTYNNLKLDDIKEFSNVVKEYNKIYGHF